MNYADNMNHRRKHPTARTLYRHTPIHGWEVHGTTQLRRYRRKGRGEVDEIIVKQGIISLIYSSRETLIILKMHARDIEATLVQLSKAQQSEPAPRTQPLTVNLPQMSLPTFSADPKKWREFWSAFEAAVHNQPTDSRYPKVKLSTSLPQRRSDISHRRLRYCVWGLWDGKRYSN